jgi:predicted Rossmann-fold nucleotide-binding protein
MAEFVDSFQTMSQVGPAVTIFGSARLKPTDKYYKAAQDIARGLAKHNLAVITGGGPGIMEAANKGASHPVANLSASTSNCLTSRPATNFPTYRSTSIISSPARSVS